MKRIIGLFAVLAILACGEEEEPRRIPSNPEPGEHFDASTCGCKYDVYDPVCGINRNGHEKDFYNVCEATCYRFRFGWFEVEQCPWHPNKQR